MTSKTLIDILTGTLSYDSSWGIYAEKIDGEFKPESSARFGQRQFENGGLLDDCKFFLSNESAQDRLDSLTGYTDGTAEEREHVDEFLHEAAEMLIDEINQQQ